MEVFPPMSFDQNTPLVEPILSAEETAAKVDEVMKKYDRESNVRIWEGVPKKIVMGIQIFFSLFCLYVTLFATWYDQVRLTSFVGLAIIMGFLAFPLKKGTQKVNHMPWYDILIMVVGASAYFYFCFNAETLIMRLPTVYPYEVVIGLIGILALLELCRRSVGLPILCVAGFFILYAGYYYAIKNGLGFDAITTLVYRLFYTTTGIFSTPVNVCSKFIVVFLLFGAFLERSGIADFFIDFANSIAGAASGGPAKVAVIASALEGTVSGSSVGNTVGSGSVTIPMMKRLGYNPEFAGAVEAAASTGGQIMPPIMGAAAFLMADYVGVPYSNIIVRAILPAVLYFLGIFISVHLEAKKLGLKGISRDQLPKFKALLKETYLLLPLIILVYLVSSNTRTLAYSAAIAIVFAVGASNLRSSPIPALSGCVLLLVYLFAPLSGIVSTVLLVLGVVLVLVSMFFKNPVMAPADFADALATGGKSCVSVIAACGVAGIIAGCITMTGLASQLISGIINLTNNYYAVSVFIALILSILAFFIIKPLLDKVIKHKKASLLVSLVASVGILAGLLASHAVYYGLTSIGISWDSCELFLALFLTMLCCIVLGMGVPTTANYCIMASTCAPILIQLGLDPLPAHFFVFYFGIVADITPPVALAAYAGSAIAQANPMKTALIATKLAIAAFVVPYVFALNPGLLMIDATVLDVILNSATSILGIFGIAAGLEGFIIRTVGPLGRVGCIIGGLLMLVPGIATDAVGLVLLALVVVLQVLQNKKETVAA